MTVTKNETTGKYDVQVWYKDFKGKRKHTTKRGFLRKRDAEKWERQFLDLEHNDVKYMDTIINEYIHEIENQGDSGIIKISTVKNYTNYVNIYIRPYFKDMLVKDVKPSTISDWVKHISKTSLRESKQMSSGTIKTASERLRNIFRLAKKNHGLVSDPTEDIKLPKGFSNDKRAEFWTEEQYGTFYSSLTDDYDRALFNTFWHTGMRKGEVLGFFKEDIISYTVDNAHCHAIKVSRNFVKLNSKKEYIGTPKSNHSYRIIPIPDFLYDQLMKHCEVYCIGEGERVFDIDPSCLNERLKSKLKQLDLPHISLHTLRHSFASSKLDLTKDAVLIASLLGHGDAKVLFEHYAHLMPTAQASFIKTINKIE